MADISTYKDAGVDIDKADTFINSIKPLVRSTYRTGVLGEIGAFGGMFHLGADRYNDPVLVSSTDGVGTKIKIAVLMNRHDTIGIDLVAMCANDIVAHGATPLFFLDYLAVAQLSPEIATLIVEGITQGCKQARCSLIGGETAEMPGIYQPGDYDLTLRASAQAVNRGVRIPGLNDETPDGKPDIGAHERGSPLPHYGPRAPGNEDDP